MGFKDLLTSLLGTTTLPRASLDQIFAISSASVTIESESGLQSSERAGVCFKPIESSRYSAIRTEIEELLTISTQETNSTFRLVTDEFRFTWVILEDPDFDDLVAGIHLISQTFIEKGLDTYLLCAVFRFGAESPVYWIYNFKQASFYPFIPSIGKNRDNAAEFRMRSLLKQELHIEDDVGKWYPLWAIPL